MEHTFKGSYLCCTIKNNNNMKYKIFQKVVVNRPCHESTTFDTLEECVAWLTITHLEPIDYVIVDTETNEWFDGHGLAATIQTDYQKLFSYRT